MRFWFPITPRPSAGGASGVWRRPTYREFVRRAESEFGLDVRRRAPLGGLAGDESLGPDEIEAACAELGLPPEDFGVGSAA